MTASTYFVYESMNGEYKFVGTVEVNDGEKAKKKAVEKYYADVPVLWRPHVRVSTTPLGKHANCFLPNFLPKHP